MQGTNGRGGGATESRPGMVNGIPLKDLAEKKPQYQVTFSVEFGDDLLDEESQRGRLRKANSQMSA